jgi:hypothetical protein
MPSNEQRQRELDVGWEHELERQDGKKPKLQPDDDGCIKPAATASILLLVWILIKIYQIVV